MPLDYIDQATVTMIKSKQALNKLQVSYYDLQNDWSEKLEALIHTLLEEKKKTYKSDPSNPHEVNWDEESEPSLVRRYKGLQRVIHGFTNLGEYENMTSEEAILMMEQYGLKGVQYHLEEEEAAMNAFLSDSLIPGIDVYQRSVKSTYSKLCWNVYKIKESPDKEMMDSCLSLIAALALSLVPTSKNTMFHTRLSVSETWAKSIQICLELERNVGEVFKEEIIKAVVKILKMPHEWKDNVLKYAVVNTSSVFCIKTPKDMEMVMECAQVQKSLIDNKAAIESRKLTIDTFVEKFGVLKEGQEEPPAGLGRGDMVLFYQKRYEYLEAKTLMECLPENKEKMLQNAAQLVEFITSQETPFASASSGPYEEWVKGGESEMVSPILEALTT